MPRHTPALLAAALLLGASVAEAFGPPLLGYRTGNYRQAVSAAREGLMADPDSADMHTIMAISLAKAGYYQDALPHFLFGMGSPTYESEGLQPHADALRATGAGVQAAALRDQVPLVTDREGALLTAQVNKVDDLRVAGEWGAALDAADDAVGSWPRSGLAHAAYAELLVDLGQLDEAGLHLWLAQRTGGVPYRSKQLEARLELLDGNTQGAHQAAGVGEVRMRAGMEMVATRAELLLLDDRPDEALYLLYRPRFTYQLHPRMLVVEAQALHAIGDLEQARWVMHLAASNYPLDASVQRAAEALAAQL